MTCKTSGFIVLAGISALTNAAYATQPSCAGSNNYFNTACGTDALLNITTGAYNTAIGPFALLNNTTSFNNTASGFYALLTNTTGAYNTANGSQALHTNTTGAYNTVSGYKALYLNDAGNHNTAYGVGALYSTNGSNSTAAGADALFNSTGSSNIAVGFDAGYNIASGSNNIDIGNEGLATDIGIIRIGTGSTQKGAFIAGVVSSKVTGSAVYVTTGGRLGVLASSERYKTAIEPMGGNTAKLEQLRPVTFKLKIDSNGTIQYGLIAEEVAKVYPELVIRDDRGRIDGVRYDELAPMLLNEIQNQQRINAEQITENSAQATKIASLEQQLAGIQAALVKLQPKDELVAQR